MSQGKPRNIDDIVTDALTIGDLKAKQVIDGDAIPDAVGAQNL